MLYVLVKIKEIKFSIKKIKNKNKIELRDIL